MSADVPFLVKVLKVFEAEIVVYAVTSEEASIAANKLEGVCRVVEVNPLLDGED